MFHRHFIIYCYSICSYNWIKSMTCCHLIRKCNRLANQCGITYLGKCCYRKIINFGVVTAAPLHVEPLHTTLCWLTECFIAYMFICLSPASCMSCGEHLWFVLALESLEVSCWTEFWSEAATRRRTPAASSGKSWKLSSTSISWTLYTGTWK